MSSYIVDAEVAVMGVMHSCRCCLRRPADRDLTAPYTHLGTTEIYSDMLKECFDLHLTVGGDGSCGICSACVGRLRDASDFKLQVWRSQVELLARLQGALLSEDSKPERLMLLSSVFTPEEADIEAAGDDSVGDMLNCETRVEAGTAAAGGTDDEMSHSELEWPVKAEESEASDEDCISFTPVSARASSQLAMTCSVRLERLRGDEAPHATLATLHESRRASRMKETHDNTEEAYTCDTCGKHFTGKSSLIAHVRRHLTRDECAATYSCRTCSQQFSCKYLFAKHTHAHTAQETYGCDMCSKQFGAKSILIRHIKVHVELKRHSSGVSSKTVKWRAGLTQHKRFHTVAKPYTCEQCHKRFAQKANFDRHKRTHTGVKPYICEECKKQFTRKDYLNAHKRTHTGVKPYSCKECHKRFTQKTHLATHKITHTGVKPYSCGECKKQFTRKFVLEEHKRIHTGEKPYSCGECKKQFTHKQYLDRHKRTHTEDKPYRCEVYTQPFKNKGEVDTHTGSVHNEEQGYMCEICESLFSSKLSLMKHIQVHMTSNA